MPTGLTSLERIFSAKSREESVTKADSLGKSTWMFIGHECFGSIFPFFRRHSDTYTQFSVSDRTNDRHVSTSRNLSKIIQWRKKYNFWRENSNYLGTTFPPRNRGRFSMMSVLLFRTMTSLLSSKISKVDVTKPVTWQMCSNPGRRLIVVDCKAVAKYHIRSKQKSNHLWQQMIRNLRENFF